MSYFIAVKTEIFTTRQSSYPKVNVLSHICLPVCQSTEGAYVTTLNMTMLKFVYLGTPGHVQSDSPGKAGGWPLTERPFGF